MDRLAAMEAFIRVVDAGSFSDAGKQLRIGQPAISKTIAKLEDRLGVRLLLRSTHGLTPTEAGRNFYERAKRAIEEADEAELAACGAAARLSGHLRFFAPLTLTRMHVMPHLSTFLAEHPALDLDVVLADCDIDLVEAGMDVALLMGRLPDSAVTARKIGQCQKRVIGTSAYFEVRGVPRTPADLVAHQAIVYEQRDGGATWAFRQGPSETTVTMSGRLRVSAGEGVREAVFAGLGFAVTSEWLFAPELKSGAVTSVPGDWLLPPVDLWAVFPAGRQASAKARAFADFIQSQMSNSELTTKASEQISDDRLSGHGFSMERLRTESTSSAGGTHYSELAAAA
jgi:DNA-binding transcriptional LysR family regulator